MPAFPLPTRLTGALRDALPRGHALPDHRWSGRHRWILRVLCAHIPALALVALLHGISPVHAALHVLPVAVLTALAGGVPGRRAASLLAAAGLLTCSALLVHITDGLIEAHFHFFVVMSVLAFYEDWAVYGLAVGYVLLHHGLAGASSSVKVFDHPEAVQGWEAWKWAAVHAMFIFFSGVANVLLWRMNERSRVAAGEEAEGRARAEAVAEALASSLVPEALPAIPGLRVAARYLPGEGGVGGDFLEVVELGDGRVGVALGDVAGHGVKAAALTAKLRHTLRAYARDGLAPRQVMDRLERSLAPGESATCAYLVLDPAAETLTVSRAGHPAPLVARPDGAVTFLEGGLSVPLAALGVPHVEDVAPFLAGSTLLLYTDGLVERRSEGLDRGLARLAQAVRGLGADPGVLAHDLPAALADGPQLDDVALVAVRTEPAADRVLLHPA